MSREELVELFWQSDAPQSLADFCSAFACHFIRTEPMSFISERELLDPSVRLPAHEVAMFQLAGQPFGDTLYLSVLCGQHVIVPPFPIQSRELLPKMFPSKEAPIAANARAADAALTTA